MNARLTAVLLFAWAGSAAASRPGPDASYALPAPGSGAIVRLANGQVIDGVFLRREGDTIWLGVDQGEIGVGAGEIVSAEARATADAEFRARLRAAGPGDAAGFWALSVWANARGLDASARLAARRAVEARPDHAQARAFLGEEKVGARWLPRDEAQAARGFVEDEGRWVTRREKAELEEGRRLAAEARQRLEREAALQTRLDWVLAAREEAPVYVVAGFTSALGDGFFTPGPPREVRRRRRSVDYTIPLYPGAQPFFNRSHYDRRPPSDR